MASEMASETATEPQPSILIPHPQKLPGPSLLHQLLRGADAPEDASSDEAAPPPALDYQAPNGQRTILSYRQLHHKAQLLASTILQRLLEAGKSVTASADFVVPVLIPQAPELYVSLLGILKAGGAFCPIQLDAPSERIRFILGDVAAQVILTTEAMAARLPADLSVEVVLVDKLGLFDFTATDRKPDGPPARIPTPEDLAYVMYTSGSTGTPKGVGVPHIAATQSLLAHHRHVPVFARFLNFAAPTFDVSVFEIFFPWFRGATLVSCSRAELLNDLPAAICGMNVDACELTPTVAGSLLRSRANAPNLRLLLTIGEMLTEPVVREFGAGPDRPSILWAMYGPTEAAIHCTLQPALDGAASVKNIGFPLDTVSAYILEAPVEGQPVQPGDPKIVPLGEVGELAVGGYQLARGYINRPEQTAAAFIDTEKYGRLYRTGDKARITEDGILECSGRISGGQVKLRGQRIELGEVEQAAIRADGCLGCAAAVINGNLVAFCDVGASADDMEDKILASCKAWLPRFMIPGDFVIMRAFPRLASGKVDRITLVKQYGEAQKAAAAAVPPPQPTAVFQDDLDRLLHEMAREILGHGIDSTSSLGAAGMDSLKSIRFASAIRAAGFANVSAVDVLDAKSLAALHTRVEQLKKSSVLAETPSLLDTDEVFSEVPLLRERTTKASIAFVSECTPVQVAMLSETLVEPQAYCNWVELTFAKPHTTDKIASCFALLVDQNEALRTGFVHFRDRFVQVVRQHASPRQIREVDVSGLLAREFVLDTDQSFLHPFEVEIQEQADGSVHAVLRVHHAVYDGWSLDLIRADLEAMLRDADMATRPSYSLVARHYHAISVDDKDAAKQFWAQSLNGHQAHALPELLFEHPAEPGVFTQTSQLASVDAAAVDQLAKTLGCGTQSVFQAALAWLWSALVGSPDVVLGTVSSGRTLPVDGIEATIGPCLQTIPLRADLAQMKTIQDLLNNVQAINRAVLPHAFLPLGEIKKTAGLRPGQPLYDVLFVYQESLFSQRTAQDLVAEVAHKDYLETKLLWEIEPVADTFHVRATFHDDVFPPAQIAVMLEQYASIVRFMAHHADEELAAVGSCFPDELLSCRNIDFTPYAGSDDLVRLVQRSIDATPDREAVCFAKAIGENGAEFETLTYGGLGRLSNRIARLLKTHGAAAGDSVAIIMDKSVLFYAGILGILKAGCVYLPALPSTPAARAGLIIDQAGVQLCLTDTATAQNLISGLPVTALDLQKTQLDTLSDANLDIIPSDLSRGAYTVFTSGSTGTPKGVHVTHYSVCSNLDILGHTYPSQAHGRFLQSCSPAFDVSIFEIFFTWKTGMCLCAAVNDVLFDDLERAVRNLQVTHLSMTPTVAALVQPQNTPLVEFIVVAGEALSEKVARTWEKQMYAAYGPSEMTNICALKKGGHGQFARNIGHGLDNTSSFILVPGRLEALPRGAVGELCYGGDQVAAGYLHLPEATAQKFIEHPQYGRLYRTGDIGRMLADGSLIYAGRLDEQVKLRGQRIELNEINAVLEESDLAAEPLTLLLRTADDKPELLASFFVPTTVEKADAAGSHVLDLDRAVSSLLSQLFSLLHARLPAYMVPTHLIPLSSIPATASAGKANRQVLSQMFRALPQEVLSATSSSFGAAAADGDDGSQWTTLEKQVAGIVSEALGVDKSSVGRWTPLPSLGLDSISAIRLSKMVYKTLERRLAISDILKNASVARLAQALGDDSSVATETPLYPLDTIFSAKFLAELRQTLTSEGLTLGKVLPCTPLQEGMLVSPTRGQSYVNRMLLRLHVAPETMQAAWQVICGRHESLRTCFVTTDNASHPIAQVVLQDWQPAWLEYSAGDELGSIEAVQDRHVQTLAADPVDAHQPPVSFAVIRNKQDVFLSFVCHHAVYDGEAMERLLLEVEQAVQDASQVLSTPAPTFDAFLAQALALPPSTDAFWQSHLAGFEPRLLQSDAAASVAENKTHTQTLKRSLSSIQTQTQTLGFSLLSLFQGVWATVLHLVGDADDVCFGNVYNGRSLPLAGLDALVAPCFNTLPVRASLAGLRSHKELLAYFQDLNPEMMRHQFTPLRQIQRQHLRGGHLFDSLFLLQQPSRPLDGRVWTLEADDGEMDFSLVCELIPDRSRDCVTLRLHHDTAYISAEATAVVSELFATLVDTLLYLSSSRIARRVDLPGPLRTRLDGLDLKFEQKLAEAEALPAPNTLSPAEDWNATESTIRTVLASLSGVAESSIQRRTTLYRLGLDSVRAVQVAAQLRKQGLAVSAVDVMEHPSSAELAGFIAKSSAAVSESSAPSSTTSGLLSKASLPSSSPSEYGFGDLRTLVQPTLAQLKISSAQVEAVLPCTPLQASLLAEFYRSQGRHYLNFVSWQAISGVTAEQWTHAWQQVAAVTPMLRTGFVAVDHDSAAGVPSPFAMVQQTAVQPATITLVPRAQQALFNVAKWQLDATQRAVTHTHLPPWQVVIVEGEGAQGAEGATCHLAIHHALYDAASLATILANVARSVQGLAVEAAPTTETAVWEILQQVKQAAASSELAEAWKRLGARATSNAFPVLTPLKVQRPAVQVATQHSAKTFAELAAAARQAGFTVHAALQAAWTRILAGYVGDAGVVFGTVLSGRSSEATVQAVFPCLSTLPVIAANEASNRKLVEQMMEANILLHKTQHVALSQIQKWLGVEARLFDTLLVFQNGTSEENVPWKAVREEAEVDYPVSLEIVPQADGRVEYQMTYDDGVLPDDQAALLLRQFDAVVCHLLLQPDGQENDLVAAEPGLFSTQPARDAELPSSVQLLHEFVEQQADRIPHKTALQFVTAFDAADQPVAREWTYKDLNELGDVVAQQVAEHAAPGSIVGVCFDKCPEAFFSILGVLKAGCSFVALDPGAPPARKEFILQDSQAALLLTTGLFDTTIVPILDIDEADLQGKRANKKFKPSRLVLPSDICYCLYTSGTTGTPKGCAITHENAVQAMLAFQELFADHYDADARWLQFASFHFDVSVLEQYWTWSVGVVLVGAPRDLILEDLAGTIARLGITHIDLTPSLGRLLDPQDVPSLCRGVFITGGEPLKPEMLDAWGPTGAVHNFYGPTEATIGVTSFPQVPQNGRASNIGRPFANVGSFVFAPGTQTPVLRGAVGELCVAGKLVGQGYLGRDDLTRERFPTLDGAACPGFEGTRVYRTGDLVRLLHDGCYDFLGRADDQVKLRGQRLEIGEINHAIRQGVGRALDDVATLVVRDEANKKDFLVSFVVLAETSAIARRDTLAAVLGDTAAPLARQVQAACRERLPGYMVPTYVVQLPYMPLSANNKAEAKELRRLFQGMRTEERIQTTGAGADRPLDQSVDQSVDQSDEYASSPVVLSVLRQLGLADVLTPTASIFELGIDSISVLRFARALKQAGLPATPSLVLAHPVLADLLAALDAHTAQAAGGLLLEARLAVEACQHRSRGAVVAALQVAAEDIEYVAPCSALQQGMVSRSRAGQDHAQAYFNTFALELRPDVSPTKLQAAWATVVQRHAILRTRFVVTGDGVVQAALRRTDLCWSLLDCANLPERHAAWVADNDGDVVRRPLEFFLVSNPPQLVVHIFHALYDAASLDLLLEQVAGAYADAPWTAGPTFLEALIHGPLRSYGDSRAFWEAHLGGVFEPLTTGDGHGDGHGDDITARKAFPSSSIHQLCVALGVTHAAVVQAIWLAVLQETFAGSSTSLGLVLAGRALDDLDAEQVVGPLFNTLPFRVARTPNTTWAALARTCHAFNTAVLPFQQVPLRDIQKWCAGGQPLFDILFSFQLGEATSDSAPWTTADSTTQADYPLALEATLGTETLELLLVAQPGVVDKTQAIQMLNALQVAAEAMTTNPEGLVSADGEYVVPAVPVAVPAPISAPASAAHPPFEWTATAAAIRDALAVLSSAAPASIHPETTLLELGLDSVDTIKLSARLRAQGIRLTNSQLIRGQCIAAFVQMAAAAVDDDAKDAPARDAAAQLQTVSAALRAHLADAGHDLAAVEAVLPPTPLQEGLVADMLQSGCTRYFNHDILALEPDVDVSRLRQAWLDTVQAHPVLRTVFYPVDSPAFDMAYCQAVQRDVSVMAIVSDVVVASPDDLSAVVDAATQRAVAADGAGGLLQLAFVTDDTQHRYLVLSIAHALYDGWSLGLLHRRVAAAYHSGTAPAPAVDADHLAAILYSSGPAAAAFWRGFLADARPTHVRPVSTTTPAVGTTTTVRLETASAVAAADLARFCRDSATSMQVVGQACWAAVLSGLTRSLDVVFGVVLSGRDADAADAALFPMMNTVLVRAILHGGAAGLLHDLQANMGRLRAHQHFPLRKAQRMVAAASGGDVFNTLFTFQKRVDEPADEPADAPLMHSVRGHADVEYPVCVEMELVAGPHGDTVVWRTACDSAFVDNSDAVRLLHALDAALHFLVAREHENLLRFEDGGVSVCGLPAFLPEEKEEKKVNTPQPQLTSSSWSPVEETIRDTLAAVSGVPAASIARTGQTLYHLGLDSISAIKVSALLRKTHGIALGVRDLLSVGSVADMAERAAKKESVELTKHTDPAAAPLAVDTAAWGIPSSAVEHVLPATSLQTHAVSVWQNTDGAVFFPAFHYRLAGVAGGRAAVWAAWTNLVAEVPMLRTLLVASGAGLLQMILKAAAPPASADAALWPALDQSALACLAVQDLESGAFAVTLKIHHALYDAVSLAAILARFQALCGGAAPLGHQPVSPAWTQLLAQQTSAAAKQEQQAFWTNYLGARSPSTVSSASPASSSPRTSLFRAAVLDLTRLRAVAAQHGLGLQSLLFAAYAQTLCAQTGAADALFGVYLASRAAADATLTLYPTLCLVPVRVRAPAGRRLADVARQIQQDIHAIAASPTAAAASLWEIRAWTGVAVDSFVNFLLPDAADADEGVTLTSTSPDVDPFAGRFTPTSYAALQNNPAKDAYLDAVDVEMAVRADRLDMGVFGSQERLSDEQAAALMASVVGHLQAENES